MNYLRFLGAGCCLLLGTAAVQAHALSATCRLHQGQIEVQAYYDNDDPARQARVIVRDKDEQTIAQGRTDRRGTWLFPVPPAGQYRVSVDAGAGHGVTVALTVEASGKLAQQSRAARHLEHSSTDRAPVAITTDKPSRAEFTSTHWLKISLGVGAIALLTVALLLAVRLKRSPPVTEAEPEHKPTPR